MQKDKLSDLQSGGVYMGMDTRQSNCLLCTEDTHTLTIGATRCGKSRCVVLPSIATLALAEENMIITDPKAELYLYSAPFLERMGYEVIRLDFKNPRKSSRYNFLQPVIDAAKRGDRANAIEAARDLVQSLSPDEGATNERIWTDGERAIITACILCVVYDNMDTPEYQNLTNVYYFLSEMASPVGKDQSTAMKLYISELSTEHPAHAALGITEIAPSRMRGSFYTAALVTLSLFTDPNIYEMTCKTDFSLHDTGSRKRAIFIILPDHKSTYYGIASTFVYQQYQMLVEESDRHGNRLSRRVNFLCDEFGNFTKIPNFDKMITVGGGRGIRFHLLLQDFNQLDKIYGEKEGKTIRSNCETWLYLQTDDGTTLQELSTKLGKYTTKSPSLSSSTGGNTSASYNLTGRDLLTPDEIRQIDRPYMLITGRKAPYVSYAPDISKTVFNQLFGMGNPKHNKMLLQKRQDTSPERPPLKDSDIKLWGIWKKYQRLIMLQNANFGSLQEI